MANNNFWVSVHAINMPPCDRDTELTVPSCFDHEPKAGSSVSICGYSFQVAQHWVSSDDLDTGLLFLVISSIFSMAQHTFYVAKRLLDPWCPASAQEVFRQMKAQGFQSRWTAFQRPVILDSSRYNEALKDAAVSPLSIMAPRPAV